MHTGTNEMNVVETRRWREWCWRSTDGVCNFQARWWSVHNRHGGFMHRGGFRQAHRRAKVIGRNL